MRKKGALAIVIKCNGIVVGRRTLKEAYFSRRKLYCPSSPFFYVGVYTSHALVICTIFVKMNFHFSISFVLPRLYFFFCHGTAGENVSLLHVCTQKKKIEFLIASSFSSKNTD